MSDFNPTHEFRGLKLEHHPEHSVAYNDLYDMYTDSYGWKYMLPKQFVTKLTPPPQPGEVWKFVGSDDEKYPLVLITRDATPSFVNEEGDTIPFYGGGRMFIKVLNADGSPA